jgi:hypothetical protein
MQKGNSQNASNHKKETIFDIPVRIRGVIGIVQMQNWSAPTLHSLTAGDMIAVWSEVAL